MDIATLDALPDDAFVAAAAPWFEGAPRFLARLAADRPFGDVATLFARAEAIALSMPEDEQTELINAHPRLGAPPATVFGRVSEPPMNNVDSCVAISESSSAPCGPAWSHSSSIRSLGPSPRVARRSAIRA